MRPEVFSQGVFVATGSAGGPFEEIKIDKDKIANAWRIAANDPDIDVIAPFAIELEDHTECEFIAMIKRFGTLKGTLICLPEEWDDFGYHY